MKLLNGQEGINSVVAIDEHFLTGSKPSNLTLSGTGTTKHHSAGVSQGKLELNASALNDEAMATFEQPIRIDKWSKVVLEFEDVKFSINDALKADISFGLRLDGSNIIAIMQNTGQQIRILSRNNNVSTLLSKEPFNPVNINRYKIIATQTEVQFFVNESMIEKMTMNIPADKILKPYLSVKQLEAGTLRSLECGSVRLTLHY